MLTKKQVAWVFEQSVAKGRSYSMPIAGCNLFKHPGNTKNVEHFPPLQGKDKWIDKFHVKRVMGHYVQGNFINTPRKHDFYILKDHFKYRSNAAATAILAVVWIPLSIFNWIAGRVFDEKPTKIS